MADSSAVDAAVVAKLSGDATLMAITTDGVFFDVAKSGAQNFVIVSQVAHADDYMFGGEAFEKFTYLVKVVMLTTVGTNVITAAARVQTLLQDVVLTITGYTHAKTVRAERIRYTEVDPGDQDKRWQHRGGLYEVWAVPT